MHRREGQVQSFTAIAGKVAGIISLVAFAPYILAILRGKTKPNRATWWIWTAVSIMSGVNCWELGAENTMWIPVSDSIGYFFTAILAVKYGEGGWTKFDCLCLSGAGLSAVLWFAFSSPLIALPTIILIELFGAFPTIRKVWDRPETENRASWVMDVVAASTNIFAVGRWTSLAIVVYPIYTFFINGLIATLIFLRRNHRAEEAQ